MNDVNQELPLCVDLDGTLLRTDVLFESLLLLIKSNLLYMFVVPLWLIRGKAYLKHQVARRVSIDIAHLPYNQEFLSFLDEQKRLGRHLILVTASDIQIAQKVADYL